MEYKQTYQSPIGIISMKSDGENLTVLWFNESRNTSKHTGTFKNKNLPIFEETTKWLEIYFSGKQPKFTIPKRGTAL